MGIDKLAEVFFQGRQRSSEKGNYQNAPNTTASDTVDDRPGSGWMKGLLPYLWN